MLRRGKNRGEIPKYQFQRNFSKTLIDVGMLSFPVN